MARSLVAVAVAVQLGLVFGASSHGFGEAISWVSLEEARALGKPTFLLIHKSWCGACKALKPKFAASAEIAALSSRFSMVNTEDDEEPSGADYSPDGGYIPRILFLDASGNVLKDVINEGGSPQHKYYYPDPNAILASMNRVLASLPAEQEL